MRYIIERLHEMIRMMIKKTTLVSGHLGETTIPIAVNLL